MSLLADAHVHVYPGFALESFFAHALRNLSPGPDDVPGVFLAERDGEHWYRDLGSGDAALPDGFAVEPSADGEALWWSGGWGRRLLVIPGRQIISAECIEVLCLTHDLQTADGAPLLELLETIRSAGGIPVLPWSPGKWLGARGTIVRRIIATARPGTLLIGDTLMRPRWGPDPSIFRLARSRGVAAVAGTDPLSLPGEETLVGRYGVSLPFDLDRPLDGIRSVLTGTGDDIRLVGRRSSLVRSLHRWASLKRAR